MPLYERRIPAGPCLVSARVVLDVLPYMEPAASEPGPGERRRSSLVRQTLKSSGSEWMSASWIQNPNNGMGRLWLYHLRDQKDMWSNSGTSLPTLTGPFRGASSHAGTKVPIRDGQLTRLRVEIPTDLESRIQELLDSVTDPEQFEKSVLENNPFIRDAEITVIESKPPGTAACFRRPTLAAKRQATSSHSPPLLWKSPRRCPIIINIPPVRPVARPRTNFMLRILGSPKNLCGGMTRRDWLRIGGLGLAGLTLPDVLRLQQCGRRGNETRECARRLAERRRSS